LIDNKGIVPVARHKYNTRCPTLCSTRLTTNEDSRSS